MSFVPLKISNRYLSINWLLRSKLQRSSRRGRKHQKVGVLKQFGIVIVNEVASLEIELLSWIFSGKDASSYDQAKNANRHQGQDDHQYNHMRI